jgi:hypothetical protein
MRTFSKVHKRRLRELSDLAYERECKGSLFRVSTQFDDWKAGKMSSADMGRLLHEYVNGELNELWGRYDIPQHDMLVSFAFVKGILTETEVGSDLISELKPAIEFYRSNLE